MDNASLLFELAIKGFFITSAATMLSILLRKRSASWRHAVWLLAMSGLIVLPLSSLKAPKVEVQIPASLRRIQVVESGLFATEPISTPDPSSFAQPTEIPDTIDPYFVLVVVYLGGLCMMLVPLVIRLIAAWHLSLTVKPISDSRRFDTTGKTKLKETDKLAVPATIGFFRPIILLPTSARQWSNERMELVVAHEMAHIVRRDWLCQMVAQVACAMYWFNPLVWLGARWMRSDSEFACDDMVLARGFNAEKYADELLEIARAAKRQRVLMVCMANHPVVKTRLLAIIDPRRKRGAVHRRVVWIGGCIAVITASILGAVKIASAQTEPKNGSEQTLPVQAPEAAIAVVNSNRPGWHGPLKVTVLGPNKLPLSGAHLLFEVSQPMIVGQVAPPDGITNAKGTYVATKASFREAESRPWSSTKSLDIDGVWVYKPGYQPVFAFVKKEQQAVTVKLSQKGKNVTALLVDTSGRPAVGAKVFVRNFVPTKPTQTTLNTRPDWRQFFSAVSNRDGWVTFADCPDNFKLEIDTWDPNYCRQPWYGSVAAQNGRISGAITLTRSATVSGIVTLNGKPVSGQTVQLSAHSSVPYSIVPVATTDNQGKYRLTGVRPGVYSAQIVNIGQERSQNSVAAPIENIQVVEGKDVPNQHFELKKGVLVTGSIRYADGKIPSLSFQVGCDRPLNQMSTALGGYATADSRGNYRLRIPAGKHLLYIISIPDPKVAPSKMVQGSEGDTIKVDFVVPRSW